MKHRAADPATSEFPVRTARPAHQYEVWRPLARLSRAEAVFVVARSHCDPSTVYVTCRPGETSFAVAGRDALYGWQWAIFSATGMKLDDGWEGTLEDAQRVAMEVRRLWAHRCHQRSLCGCVRARG